MRRRLAALAVLLTGCVPYAYVLPPIDVNFDVAARGRGNTVVPQVTVSTGVRPLALVPELHARRLDFALGYTVMVLPSLVHGPSGELSAIAWSHPTGGDGLLRLRAGVAARLLYEPERSAFGAQGLGRVVFEFANLTDADFTSQSASGWSAGHTFGEWDVGCYVEGGALALPSGLGWTAGGGLILTLPAAAGVGFLWLK